VRTFQGLYWGDWTFAIAGVDGSNGTITFGPGGWQEARGASIGAELYVEGIGEEVDAPGEWYVDAGNGSSNATLYFFFNYTGGPPAGGAQPFIATQLDTVVALSASPDAPVVGVTLSGLTFAHTAPTFLRPFTVPSGGDWSFYRGGAVVLEGSASAAITGCTFFSPGGNGLLLTGWNRDAAITHNEFVWVGESAIVSAGTTALIDATAATVPANSYIGFNLIHEVGVFVAQAGGYYHALSANATLEGNVMFNGPRAGVNINDGAFGGHALTRNVLFNWVRTTSDHGPFNSWDREPYAWDAANASNLLPAQSVISQTLALCGWNCAWPLDHDDGSNAYLDTGNVVSVLLWADGACSSHAAGHCPAPTATPSPTSHPPLALAAGVGRQQVVRGLQQDGLQFVVHLP
jgi:hypothetical protein